MIRAQSLLFYIPMFAMSLELNLEGSVGPTIPKSLSMSALSALLVVAWSMVLRGVDCSQAEIEQHMEMGNKMLAAGQLADALSHYHAAAEGDPTNYRVFFRRATVYLAMGKSKSALPDLDKVLELKPDFTAARTQRGNVKLKQGKLDEAQEDYEQVVSKDPSNEEAVTHLAHLDSLRQDLDLSYASFEQRDYATTIDAASRAIELCPWDPALRELRSEAYIETGDLFKAIGDIRPTTKLRSDNTAGYFKLSNLHYQMGEADESLIQIRECLKLDPDHKECHKHYTKVKKLTKQMNSVQNFISEQRYEDCVNKAQMMLKTEDRVHPYVFRAKGHICHCYSKSGNVKEALTACNEVLEMDPENIEALCDRAEAYIADEDYEKAVSDYQAAEQVNGEIQRVHEGLKRAQKLLKQSLKRDYYKILGVKRNASKKEIVKAYRKLAVIWHPDKYENDEEKKKAEKVFIDIASAKEVLTDPEMRAKFDNGEDPLDAEEQSGGRGHPWQQGFNPFGQGGFQFKFHFN